MPISATCTRGSVVVSRPLPSFVQMQRLPVSATPKLPPEMPMSALRNPARSRRRANAVICGTSTTSSSVAPSSAEGLRDVVPVLVDDRRDDVRRMVLVDLDDELAEVRLEDVDAGAGERGVEVDLLAHHRLRFHRRPHSVLPGDVGDDGDCLFGGLGPVDVPAAGVHGCFELTEVVPELRDRVRADARARDRGRHRPRGTPPCPPPGWRRASSSRGPSPRRARGSFSARSTRT